jgi:tripartite-type tricarboxylate transporter receptor subunit TctC
MSKFAACVGVALAVLAASFSAAIADPYPTRTVEIIVSYGAGGSTDFVARAVAQKLTEKLGQPFVILNRPGASGTIGIKAAMAAKPDGYTLYVGYTSETVVVPQISKTATYSVLDDFEPIAITGLVPVVLIVSKDMHVNNLKDFIAEVRAKPGKYTYGGSIGSPPHVMGAWMNKLRGLDVQHIPYRGGAQGVTDVIGGHLDMFYGGVAVAKPAIDGGNVEALAVTGDARSSALPNVPTFKEAGVPEFDLASWTVLLAPKGTPPGIVALIRKETLAALDDPATKSALARQGVERSDNQDVRAFLTGEREKFGRAVRELSIKMGE